MSVAVQMPAAATRHVVSGPHNAYPAQQTRAPSALTVSQASDNTDYWSIATSMRVQSLSMSSAEDATGRSAALVDTATSGIESATGLVDEIHKRLLMAARSGADKSALNDDITRIKDQLGEVARSSSFDGENWLHLKAGETPRVDSIVASVSDKGERGISVSVVDFDTSLSTLTSAANANDGILTRNYSGTTANGRAYDYYLLNANSEVPTSASASEIALDDTTSIQEIGGMVSAVTSIMQGLVDAGTAVSETRDRIVDKGEFLSNFESMATSGLGGLVDTDMDDDAVREAADFIRNGLQSEGLSIANNDLGASGRLFL